MVNETDRDSFRTHFLSYFPLINSNRGSSVECKGMPMDNVYYNVMLQVATTPSFHPSYQQPTQFLC